MKKQKTTIEDSINRIAWRFKNQNIKINESKIIINEKDIEAVEFLINWVNRQKQQELQDNLLFAKIFTYAFTNEIIYYEGQPQQALSKLQEVAEKPIQEHYDNVHKFLNMFEETKYLKSIGVNFDKHPALLNNEEREMQKKKINENQKEYLKKIKGVWSFEQVYKSLNNTITEFYNKYKNG